MRAVRAALAARLAVVALLVGLRFLPEDFFLPVVAPAVLVPADFIFADFELELRADRCPECRTDSSCVCAAIGGTTIRTESSAATLRAAMLEFETGEETALILSLYSGRTHSDAREPLTLPHKRRSALCIFCRPIFGNPKFGSLPRRPLHSSFDGLIQQVPSGP